MGAFPRPWGEEVQLTYPWYNCSQALTPNCKVEAEEAARLFPTWKQKQSKTPKWSGLARRI